jgi:hypothetical protein
MAEFREAAANLIAFMLPSSRTTFLALKKGFVLTRDVVTLSSNLVRAVFYFSMIMLLLPLVRILPAFANATCYSSTYDIPWREGGWGWCCEQIKRQ